MEARASLKLCSFFVVVCSAINVITAQLVILAPPAGSASPPLASPAPPQQSAPPSPPSSPPPPSVPPPFWMLSPPPASPPPPPLEGDIFDKIRAESRYSVIVGWLDGTKYGNPSIFNKLKTEPQFTSQSYNWTIFLPTNDAMNNLPIDLINFLQKNQTLLADILLDLFVGTPGPPQTTLDATVFPTAPRDITATSTGSKLGLRITKDPFDNTLYVNNVTLGRPDDLDATNGVVHGVTDGLILQPSYYSNITCEAAFYNCPPGTLAPPPPVSPPPPAVPPASPPKSAPAPTGSPMAAPPKITPLVPPSKAPQPAPVPAKEPAPSPVQPPLTVAPPTPTPTSSLPPIMPPIMPGPTMAPGPMAATTTTLRLMAALEAAKVYTTFLSLAPLLGTTFSDAIDTGSLPMTILAPTDSAFNKQEFVDYAATLTDAQRSLLLKYHILNGYHNSSALSANNATYKTMVVDQLIVAAIDSGTVTFQTTEAVNASSAILIGLDPFLEPNAVSVQGISEVLRPSFVLTAPPTPVTPGTRTPPPPAGYGVKSAQLLPSFAYLLVALVSFHVIWAATP